ncbi:hypothetical protein A946_05630 [Methylacidiphilum kamchatkense Kam1]|uniref:Uncharacterized protein n=1 Tax=Methylacidiphilum kamchatkense Kam1 TaxID=1202785 RepID=A0ABR4ZYW2_9BACT|nr:hypothetical protein A946_05630 [Methylacidiphilum kamchatkense Kam1]
MPCFSIKLWSVFLVAGGGKIERKQIFGISKSSSSWIIRKTSNRPAAASGRSAKRFYLVEFVFPLLTFLKEDKKNSWHF